MFKYLPASTIHEVQFIYYDCYDGGLVSNHITANDVVSIPRQGGFCVELACSPVSGSTSICSQVHYRR